MPGRLRLVVNVFVAFRMYAVAHHTLTDGVRGAGCGASGIGTRRYRDGQIVNSSCVRLNSNPSEGAMPPRGEFWLNSNPRMGAKRLLSLAAVGAS